MLELSRQLDSSLPFLGVWRLLLLSAALVSQALVSELVVCGLFVLGFFFLQCCLLQSRNVYDKINITDICENCNWDMDCGYLMEQHYWKTKLLCDLKLTSSSETSGRIQSITLQEHICRSTLFSQLVPKKRKIQLLLVF